MTCIALHWAICNGSSARRLLQAKVGWEGRYKSRTTLPPRSPFPTMAVGVFFRRFRHGACSGPVNRRCCVCSSFCVTGIGCVSSWLFDFTRQDLVPVCVLAVTPKIHIVTIKSRQNRFLLLCVVKERSKFDFEFPIE